MASLNQILHIELPALPIGCTILVTGANSYVGTHIIDQLLKLDYKIRGTVRSVEKASWMAKLFAKYGRDALELVQVTDISVRGAFDEAMEGE
jgi:uncharacterized protein YbjT (DUF2867 family)